MLGSVKIQQDLVKTLGKKNIVDIHPGTGKKLHNVNSIKNPLNVRYPLLFKKQTGKQTSLRGKIKW